MRQTKHFPRIIRGWRFGGLENHLDWSCIEKIAIKFKDQNFVPSKHYARLFDTSISLIPCPLISDCRSVRSQYLILISKTHIAAEVVLTISAAKVLAVSLFRTR